MRSVRRMDEEREEDGWGGWGGWMRRVRRIRKMRRMEEEGEEDKKDEEDGWGGCSQPSSALATHRDAQLGVPQPHTKPRRARGPLPRWGLPAPTGPPGTWRAAPPRGPGSGKRCRRSAPACAGLSSKPSPDGRVLPGVERPRCGEKLCPAVEQGKDAPAEPPRQTERLTH